MSKKDVFKNIRYISWSLNEDKIVFTNQDVICLLDIEKQKIIAQIRVPFWKTWDASCLPICFTRCCRYAATGWNGGWIKLWALESQQFQKQIELTKDHTVSAAFSSCEKYLYRVTNCNDIDRYDIANRRSENWIQGLGDYGMRCATFSQCRNYVAVQKNQQSLVIWNLETKKVFGEFEVSFNFNRNRDILRFSRSGRLLFFRDWHSLVVWNLEEKKFISVDCNSDILTTWQNDQYFASSQPYNKSIEIWEYEQSYNKIQSWKPDKPIRSMLFSACGNFLYSGDYVGKIQIWDFRKAEKIREFGRCNQSAIFLEFCSRGLIYKTSRKVFLWDAEKGEKRNEANACRDKNFYTNFDDLHSFSVTKSGEWILSKGNHRTVGIWKLI